MRWGPAPPGRRSRHPLPPAAARCASPSLPGPRAVPTAARAPPAGAEITSGAGVGGRGRPPPPLGSGRGRAQRPRLRRRGLIRSLAASPARPVGAAGRGSRGKFGPRDSPRGWVPGPLRLCIPSPGWWKWDSGFPHT